MAISEISRNLCDLNTHELDVTATMNWCDLPRRPLTIGYFDSPVELRGCKRYPVQ